MATYVNNLRLKEIVTGAESGTWGTSTNTNLELIADALGSGTEAITTNADTHTTTIADGAADEGRALFLKYTGTLDSACTITLAPDTINKVWFIENATSGSQNIIISQGSGANITIGNGKVAAILTDGAGGGAAVLDAFADLELSSTLTVAGASTLTGVTTHGGNVVSDTDSTDDLGTTGVRWANLWADAITMGGTLAGAVATFSSTVGITGVTTHGGNVVSDTDSTDDLGTTGVRWANLWVDAITMGGTLTVGNITSTGNFVTSDTGPHMFGASTQDYTRLGNIGAFTSGGGSTVLMGFDNSGALTGASGDTGYLVGARFYSSIVTQTVTESIAVIAQAYFNEPAITDNLTGDITVAATVYIANAPTEGETNNALHVAAGTSYFEGDTTVTADIILGTNNTSALTGINTSGAEVNLLYLDNADKISIAGGGDAVVMGGSLSVAGTSAFTGNVGIGQSAGTSALAITEATTDTVALYITNSHATTPYGVRTSFTGGAPNDRTHYFFKGQDSSTNPKVALWSDGGATFTGNVGIGHSGDTRALVVQESDAANIAAFLVGHSGGYGVVVDYYANTPNDTSHDAFTFEDATAIRFTVKSNGGLYNYQSNDVDLSDERMKIIHNPTASKWDAHAALEVFDYHYTESPDTRVLIGVGAHQAGECDERLCATDEWETGGEMYHGIYSKDISFYTMKTVQECQARIEALEAKMSTGGRS